MWNALLFATPLLVFAVFLVSVVERSVPGLPFDQFGRRQTLAGELAPQGWNFFTRDPRLEYQFAVQKVGGRWAAVGDGSQPSAANWFGLSRNARAIDRELIALRSQVDPSAFRPCTASLPDCIQGWRSYRKVTNGTHDPLICGTTFLVQQEPLPWEWRDLEKTIVLPAKVVALDVVCSDSDRPAKR